MTGLAPLVKVQEGRLPKAKVGTSGIVEIASTVEAADTNGLIVSHVYTMQSTLLGRSELDGRTVPIRFRLVGTFTIIPKTANSPAWITDTDLSSAVYVHPNVYRAYLIQKKEAKLSALYWTWVLDHQHLYLSKLPKLIRELKMLDRSYNRFHGLVTVNAGPMDFFNEFLAKQNSMRIMMLALALPTILLVIYYAILAAGLIIDQRRGEMAMLRSRGASTTQIVASSALEWGLLGLACLIVGPPLGLGVAQLFGASAGFLNFVDRKALPIFMNLEAYQYALILIMVMLGAATIPSFKAARLSIISYKQEQSRAKSKPIWQRFYLDFLLLGLGIYGYRAMTLQAAAAMESQEGLERLVDPFLFIIPTLLVLAAGMLLLRLMPLIAKLVEKFVSRGKGVALYTSVLETSRNANRYRPLILLVVLTTATGIYGAAMARSLDQNTIDKVYYATGADAVLTEQWFRLSPIKNAKGETLGSGMPSMTIDTSRPFEPPFYAHKTMPGVESVARVQTEPKTPIVKGNQTVATVTAMAIHPVEFAHTAWLRPDLTPIHPYNYLNMLTKYPYGALVSEQLMADNEMKLGDTITMLLHKQKMDFVIVGAIKYWPTLYGEQAPFVVTNLDYLNEQSSISQYDVWLKLKPGAKLSKDLDYLYKKGVQVLALKDARREVALARRDPQKMGFYGIISIGFCVAVFVMVIGFLLYTFITLKSRFLQFGVLRAIGLSMKQLIAMLCLEQLWSVGIGLVMGTFVGEAISAVFVPFLKTAAALNGETPPFHIIISGSDIGTIYKLLLPVIILAMAGLAFILTRLQVHQAVKLGEEG
jgi:putative ABC transport system permease protein